jgi:hypothetical protein
MGKENFAWSDVNNCWSKVEGELVGSSPTRCMHNLSIKKFKKKKKKTFVEIIFLDFFFFFLKPKVAKC